MNPLVSVVIPTFNRWPVVASAIASASKQTYTNLEIIVVDDGSTEPELAGLDYQVDSRITILRCPVNRGAAAARNVGIERARGEYIAFLDSDDSWPLDKIERQLNYMDSGEDCKIDICCTGFHHYRPFGQSGSPDVRLGQNSATSKNLLSGCFVSPGSTLMARREFLRDLGPQNEKLDRFEDWEWLLRASRSTDISILPVSLAVIEPSKGLDLRRVALAGRTLRKLQGRHVLRQHGILGLLWFSASIDLECSIVALKTGRAGCFVFFGLRALVTNPVRVFNLFGVAARHLFAWVRLRVKSVFVVQHWNRNDH